MGGFIFLIFVIAVIVVFAIIKYVKIVPQANEFIIERLGAYKETLGVGMHFITPVVDKVVKKVSLKEQVLDFKPQKVITKDNVTMSIDAVVYYQITDAKMFTYAVEKPLLALETLTATTLRNIIGSMELDETLTSRDNINTQMQETIDEATDPWGIKVKRVEIKDIQPPRTILDSMEKQMKAERDRRETILEAEGHKQSVVTRAQGDKEAKVLAAEAERDAQIALAEGKARSIREIYQAEAEGLEALKRAGADESVISLKKIEALKAIADGRATKIVVPTELAGIASVLTAGASIISDSADDTQKKHGLKRENVGSSAGAVNHLTDDMTQDIDSMVDKLDKEIDANIDKMCDEHETTKVYNGEEEAKDEKPDNLGYTVESYTVEY